MRYTLGMAQELDRELVNPYVDEWGAHYGHCNACGAEGELGQDCEECEIGELVAYDDDPDPEA